MFCLVIAEPSWERIIERIRSELVHTDLFEVRLDYLEDPIEESRLKELFSLPCRIICTYRDYREGGKKKVSPVKRLEVLELCVKLGAYLIDFEWRALGAVRSSILKSKFFPEKTLISYHNFDVTPSTASLKKFLKRLSLEGIKRVKIATYAKNLSESLRVLLCIPFGKELGLEVIAFGMGERAKVSRVLNLLLGSPFTYVVASEGDAVAPGQMTISEAKRIYEVLRNV